MEERLLLDKVSILLEAIFAIAFLVPSIYILIKLRNYLDKFSKSMIIIYQVELLSKLAFFICDYELDLNSINDSKNVNYIEQKAMTRALLFFINSLFLMSLHIFVQKL